jgi:hypothetical protein
LSSSILRHGSVNANKHKKVKKKKIKKKNQKLSWSRTIMLDNEALGPFPHDVVVGVLATLAGEGGVHLGEEGGVAAARDQQLLVHQGQDAAARAAAARTATGRASAARIDERHALDVIHKLHLPHIDPLAPVLFLLDAQYELVEVRLQPLVAVVDAQLLE